MPATQFGRRFTTAAFIGLFEELGSCVWRAGSSSDRNLHGSLCAYSLNMRASGAPPGDGGMCECWKALLSCWAVYS